MLGSTGNVYNVIIAKFPSCTCPDFARGHLCKHILFVFLKVLQVPRTSTLLYQKALLQSELRDIFDNAPSRIIASVTAKKEVQQAYSTGGAAHTTTVEEPTSTQCHEKMISTDKKEAYGDCPVCFETMSADGEPTERCDTCRNCIHTDCLARWLLHSGTCVYCRTEWVRSCSSRVDEGYMNLGDIQGMRRTRPLTSSQQRYRRSSYGY